jgi:hypothetical protein
MEKERKDILNAYCDIPFVTEVILVSQNRFTTSNQGYYLLFFTFSVEIYHIAYCYDDDNDYRG